MQLPFIKTTVPDLSLLVTRWKSILDPLLANPINGVMILPNVTLLHANPNAINHKLGRMQQGWFLTDIQGSATIYRSSSFNDLTLTLTTSADVTVSIGVF